MREVQDMVSSHDAFALYIFYSTFQISLYLFSDSESVAHIHTISNCVYFYLWCITVLAVTHQLLFFLLFPVYHSFVMGMIFHMSVEMHTVHVCMHF